MTATTSTPVFHPRPRSGVGGRGVSPMKMAFSRDEECNPATEAAISAFEVEHGVSLPSDYRAFLATSGGGHPIRDWSAFEGSGDFVAHIYGLHRGQEWKRLDQAVRQIGHDLSKNLQNAVCNGGNYILLRLAEPNRGSIFFWDHEIENPNPPTFDEIIQVSGSFCEWFVNLEESKDKIG